MQTKAPTPTQIAKAVKAKPSLRERIKAHAKAIGITGPKPLILTDAVA